MILHNKLSIRVSNQLISILPNIDLHLFNYFCSFGVFSCDWLFFHPFSSSSSSSSYHNSCCHSHICNLNQHLNSDSHVALLTSQKRHEKQKRLLHSEVKCDICRGQKLCMHSCMLQHFVPLEFEGAVAEGNLALKQQGKERYEEQQLDVEKVKEFLTYSSTLLLLMGVMLIQQRRRARGSDQSGYTKKENKHPLAASSTSRM